MGRLLRATCVLLLAAILAVPAWALTPQQRERMQEHFRGLGTVKYELFAPLGSAPVGAVLLAGSGNTDELRVFRYSDGNQLQPLISLPLTSAGLSGRQPFTFLLGGKHLLTYPTLPRTDAYGLRHEIGDLTVYDLQTDGTPRQVFTLPDLEDLGFQSSSAQSLDNLLRQPSRHCLNHSGKLPVKYDYCRLSFDPEIGQYRLSHHLRALSDDGTVQAVKLNNRALTEYYAGRLVEATATLEKAVMEVESNQSVVYRNQDYIKSELDDLAAQGRLVDEAPFDDALLAYWQGDAALVLRLLEQRKDRGLSDHELAMQGLALASLRRWPEADKITARLKNTGFPDMGDYAYELVKIAEYQRLPQVVEIQLRALEHIDRRHPGLVAALARLLARAGKLTEAEALLMKYLGSSDSHGRDLSQVHLDLYRLAHANGDEAGMDKLVRASMKDHTGSLRNFVALADYLDLGRAFADAPLEAPDSIKAPRKPLDYIGEAPPGFVLP